MDKNTILIVDDEPDILEFIGYNLSKDGYEILKTNNGNDAVALAREHLPQLILLDVMMPGMDGIETCEQLRSIRELDNCIIAFLTARGEDYSQIAGFDAGGDDYIIKPIKPKVLMSRVKALLKRMGKINQSEKSDDRLIYIKDIIIDRDKFVVIKNGEELFLPKKEFELLNLLITKPNKVFTREEIFQSVWGDDIVVGDRTIDVHIRKLREKLGEEYIKTVKGVGYKFVK